MTARGVCDVTRDCTRAFTREERIELGGRDALDIAAVLACPFSWGQRGRGTEAPCRGIKQVCAWCGARLTGRRLSWCSEPCIDAFLFRKSWPLIATYVRIRDRVCQGCGCETPPWRPTSALGAHWMASCALVPWWEVDHIVPVADGGTDDPRNLRLLCHACHVRVTSAWRRVRALRRSQG